MPLIRPEIQEVLRSAGLAPEKKSSSSESSVSEQMNEAGLSIPEILQQLSSIAKDSKNEALQARVLETALKVHGVMKETAPPVPSFTIIINEPAGASADQPRGVNPILLPRQLHQIINIDKQN